MTKPLLAAIAALAIAATAPSPAHAGPILTITPGSQTVVLPESGSVDVDFELFASADSGATGPGLG
jgi:hypothetical protein